MEARFLERFPDRVPTRHQRHIDHRSISKGHVGVVHHRIVVDDFGLAASPFCPQPRYEGAVFISDRQDLFLSLAGYLCRNGCHPDIHMNNGIVEPASGRIDRDWLQIHDLPTHFDIPINVEMGCWRDYASEQHSTDDGGRSSLDWIDGRSHTPGRSYDFFCLCRACRLRYGTIR